MKHNRFICFIFCIILILAGCTGQNTSGYDKYTYEFIGAFDTVIQFMGYSKSCQEFEAMAQAGQARFFELNKLYDIYNDYEGINNIKTINDNAGIKPVEVREEIIDLILFSKEWHHKTNGKCNIALGPMLSIWHEYRDKGIANPEEAKLPPVSSLQSAMEYTDINKIIVDNKKKTVYLAEKNMKLDVGAVAKGFASEIVAKELMEKGYTSFIISSGGNVRVVGRPLDASRKKWGIALQDPNGNPFDPEDPALDTLYLNDKSVVTSGDYQRFYEVNGKKYHHLIDPGSLMPANYFRAVTVVTEDSGLADFMSTTLFLTPFEEGLKLCNELNIESVWIFSDGTLKATDGAKKIMKNLGGASNKD